jgi:hypothetical protein
MDKLRERKWPTVIITPITVSGDKLILPDTRGLHPKQQVTLLAPGQPELELEIKRVLDPFTIQVGPSPEDSNAKGKFAGRPVGIDTITSVSAAYNGGTLKALEQKRTSISSEAVWPAVYAEEPTVAIRTIGVNYFGTPLDQPEAEIEAQDPIARFIYGPSLEILFIREFAPGAAIGDPLKITQFTYGPSLEVLLIDTYASTVQASDLAAVPAQVLP